MSKKVELSFWNLIRSSSEKEWTTTRISVSRFSRKVDLLGSIKRSVE